MEDPAREIRETCELAVARLRWLASATEDEKAAEGASNPYESTDPTPPLSGEAGEWSTDKVGDVLADEGRPLFMRYQAMFTLRNRGGADAVEVRARARVGARTPQTLTRARAQQLVRGFKSDSALLRHEVAYVLGQMAHPAAARALAETLSDEAESAMVRHEAAEALGSIEGEDEAAKAAPDVLRKFAGDSSEVVRESCEVALDMAAYWEEFESEAVEKAAADGKLVAVCHKGV